MNKHLVQQGGLCIAVICACMLGWSLLVENLSERAAAAGNHAFIRLHVLANSDSPEDQRLKLLVRDAVVRHLEPLVGGIRDKEDAKRCILAQRAEVIRVASETLLRQGVYYPVEVEYGMFDFPIKSYGELVIPAGRYEALRVKIGDAAGANWWCVLFPPLCFVDESQVAHQSGDAVVRSGMGDVEESLEFRWKVAEWIKSL